MASIFVGISMLKKLNYGQNSNKSITAPWVFRILVNLNNYNFQHLPDLCNELYFGL